jgi:hypothetical protein
MVNATRMPAVSAGGVGGKLDLRRTDEWDQFYPNRLSITKVARW